MTWVQDSIVVETTDTVIAVEDTARRGTVIQNIGVNPIFMRLDGGISQLNEGIRIAAGERWIATTENGLVSKEEIHATAETAAVTVLVSNKRAPVRPEVPVVPLFLDTFTDAETTALTLHSPDTGGGWQTSGSNLMQILSNRATNIWAGSGVVTVQIDGAAGAEHAIGQSAYCDIYKPSVAATNKHGGFLWLGDGANDYLTFYLFHTNDTTSQFRADRFATAGSFDQQNDLGSFALALSAGIRLGMTIISATEFQLWREAVGGGPVRTNVHLYTVGANYLDATHNRLGLRYQAIAGGDMSYDNLTLLPAAA